MKKLDPFNNNKRYRVVRKDGITFTGCQLAESTSADKRLLFTDGSAWIPMDSVMCFYESN